MDNLTGNVSYTRDNLPLQDWHLHRYDQPFRGYSSFDVGLDDYKMWTVVHPGDDMIVNQCRDSSGLRVTGCYCAQLRRGYG